jgi:hypothetical protein
VALCPLSYDGKSNLSPPTGPEGPSQANWFRVTGLGLHGRIRTCGIQFRKLAFFPLNYAEVLCCLYAKTSLFGLGVACLDECMLHLFTGFEPEALGANPVCFPLHHGYFTHAKEVPPEGFEPSHPGGSQVLNLLCLPLHHGDVSFFSLALFPHFHQDPTQPVLARALTHAPEPVVPGVAFNQSDILCRNEHRP